MTNGTKATVSAETAKERFDLARELIRHEDGLVNSRVTWLQVFQALLFTAFFAGLGLFKESNLPNLPLAQKALVVALSVLALLGIASSYAAYHATLSALAQIYAVEEWWRETGYQVEFPPLAGTHGVVVGRFRILGAHMLLSFAVVWMMFLALFLYVAFNTAPPKPSIEQTSSSWLRHLEAAAYVKR